MVRRVTTAMAAVVFLGTAASGAEDGPGTAALGAVPNGTIADTDIESLPTGRNFTDFTRLTPGVSASLSFGTQINDSSYGIDAIGGGQQLFNSDGFSGAFVAGYITYENLFDLTRGGANRNTRIFVSPRIGFVRNTTGVGSLTNLPLGVTTTNYSGRTEMEWLTLGAELSFHNDDLPNPFGNAPAIFSIGADFGVIGENRTFNDAGTFERSDEEKPVLFDMFYNMPVGEKITIAPGFYAIFNANGPAGDDTIFVGALKATIRY